MNTDNLSRDIEGLLASSDPAVEVTELELMRSRKRSLSVMGTNAQLVSRANTAAPSRPRGRTRLWIGTGALAGVGLLAGSSMLVTALAPTPPDRFLDATRIIPNLSEPQKETDKIPPTVDPEFVSGIVFGSERKDIDPATTRRVGESATVTYYAAPAGNDMICLIDVKTATGASDGLGCVMLDNFERFGIKVEASDRTEGAWLVVPAAVEKSLESVKNQPGWTQQAPNFLVLDNRQQ